MQTSSAISEHKHSEIERVLKCYTQELRWKCGFKVVEDENPKNISFRALRLYKLF